MARGRKVNSNGERSKQLLLEKAIELFSTHGYHETKISDIVTAANVTQPTFYLYFKSKEKLFYDLNEEFKKNLLSIFTSKLESLTNNSITPREFMHECVENAFTYFKDNPNLTKIGFYESQSANELKDQIVQLFIKALSEQGELILHNEIEVEIDTLAYSILGSIERLTLKYILTKQQTPQKLANDILNIYFSANTAAVTR